MAWTSTMGAALTADEEDRIAMAWNRLITIASTETPDPLEMLNFCTDTTMAIYELRKAINTAWNNANARRWPTPKRALPKGVYAVILDEDPAELHSILAELFGEV